MNNLKHRQKIRENILEFIILYIETHGYPPSVREIGEGVNLKSTSSVYSHLTTMIKEGTLETDAKPGTPRALRVPGYKYVPTGSSTKEISSDMMEAENGETD